MTDSAPVMVCPCCGGPMDRAAGTCACGARLVGEPLLEPASPRPRLGASAAAVGLSVLSAASLWSRPLVALAPIAVAAGVRAARAARRDPVRYGGGRSALAGAALAAVVAAGVGGWTLSGVPRALREREESKAAATRAEMYHLAGALQEYKAHYGAYPARLGDLSRLKGAARDAELRDSWDGRFSYAGFTRAVASSGRPTSIDADYELRAPGADGLLGTPDDFLMRDGMIVDPGDAIVAPQPSADSPRRAPAPADAPSPRRRSDVRPNRGSGPAPRAERRLASDLLC